jgi:hypothetical protein
MVMVTRTLLFLELFHLLKLRRLPGPHLGLEKPEHWLLSFPAFDQGGSAPLEQIELNPQLVNGNSALAQANLSSTSDTFP